MNNSLIFAKNAKNDEFYTLYSDIEKELCHYDFSGKVVYCNCDTKRSNFVKYFIDNFKSLGLKKLIATGYNKNGHGSYLSYDGERLFEKELIGDGSYDSDECWFTLLLSDIVVSNPPFSEFRSYIDFLEKNHAKYIVVGTENAVVYKNVFPLVRDNKLHCGYNLISSFVNPDGEIVKFGNICWWTNVDDGTSHVWKLGKTNSIEYPAIDNYDAIMVNRVKDIPTDYDKPMAVPITYTKYYNPRDFKILGVTSSSVENAGVTFKGGSTSPKINGKKKYARLIIKKAS